MSGSDRDDALLQEGEEEAPPGVRLAAIVRWSIVIAMALVATASLLYYFGAFSPAGDSSSGKTVYYCPMHPSVVQDHPGECPICNMTLVPKEAGAQIHPSAETSPASTGVPGLVPVELTAERIQLLGMRTAVAKRELLNPEIRTVGFVTASEPGLVEVHTRFSGWVEQLLVSQTGAKVSSGQVLATIYSPELLAAQQELLNALRWSGERGAGSQESHDLTAGLAEDARHRLELLGIAAQEIDGIVRTGKARRALPIRSPANGHVTRKDAVQGVFVQPGAKLFELADLSTVWVLAEVYEYEVGRVRLQQKARLQLASYASQGFEGKVEFINPTLDPDTRTLRVRLVFQNPDLKLRPGMYGDVVIKAEQTEGLVVPSESVVDTGEVQYAFVAREGGRFEPRKVRLGMRSGPDVEILDGLSEGETVVTTANFLIDSESRLRAAIEGLTAEGASAPSAATAGGQGSSCDTDFDRQKFPDKYQQCRACELQHHGMGTMEADCKSAIAKPWR